VIIDFHVHVLPPEMKEKRAEFCRLDGMFREFFTVPKARIASAEDLIATMDECGIDVSVLLSAGWDTNETCRLTNDYALEAAARYPKRLVAFCVVQPRERDAAVLELERCARGGARGIGEMRSDSQGYDLGDRGLMEPIVEVALKHNMVYLTHASEPVGHAYPGKGSITPDAIYRFVSNFPELRVVCAHWGGGLPFYALMPEVATALSNTYFDCAATPFLYRPQVFESVAKIVGADRILFGSDCPLLSPKRVMEQVESSGLSPESRSMILGGNAQRLLGWM
jgi:predicted TIM-barrel fold metal-dependent hydrolase